MRRAAVLAALAAAGLSACRSAPRAPRAAAAEAGRPGQAAPGEAVASGPQLAPESEPRKAVVLGKDPSGCTWVQSFAMVTVGSHDTRHQVHAAAVDEARKAAMQDFLGVEVRSRLLDYQQSGLRDERQVVESMLQTTRLGRILDEKVLAASYMDLPGCQACRYKVLLKTCLVQRSPDSDKEFRVELRITPRTRFVEGDEARIEVHSTRDAWLYIYNVDLAGQTALVVPNELVPQVRVKAGETFEYPGPKLREKGIKLVAQLPPGLSTSAETIRVVAAKAPLSRQVEDPAFGGYLGVFRRLSGSSVEWTDDAQAFTIYKD